MSFLFSFKIKRALSAIRGKGWPVMKTVADLKKEIPFQRTGYVHMPSAKTLEQSGLRVVEESYFEENCRITVYENGYVAYRAGGRYTVFLLYKVPDDYEECCGSRFYSSFREDGTELSEQEIVLEHSQYQIPWDWHLRMYAQERMMKNSMMADKKAARKLADRYFTGKQGVKKENSEAGTRVMQSSYEDELLFREMLQLAYDIMTPKQKEVFELYLEERLSYKQIAERCNLNVPAVGMLIKRAKERLRKNKDKFC